ncbi:MAG: ATP-binding protein [bacterium]|nr:ATP-binding protein [Parabacteroides sp.]MDD6748567.1 ATP-binding protein [bacterium]MDD6767319.1 ATP-binding protein [bacterium]MDY4845321.1 ATP-binding protein [Parabacteroides sp.]
MNTKEKITLSVGVLVSLIVALVALSVISLQILTATEPTSPVAEYGLTRALLLLLLFGTLSIAIGVWMLVKLPTSITRPFQELTNGINEIANHNYDTELCLTGSREMEQLSSNFNRMARRLRDYHNSSLSQLRVSKQYIETIIDSIDEPIICMDQQLTLYFINNEALDILNLKRADVLGKSAQEIAMRNDLLRRLLVGMSEHKAQEGTEEKRSEPIKIYADNKESYFQVKYLPVMMTDTKGDMKESGTVILLKNITEFHKLDVAKTTFISTISHELKTPISAILMSQQLLADNRVGTLNSEQKELSDSIRENGERLLSITGELLNMTQVESGALQLKPHITKPIELIEYAIKANQVQADKFHINIEVEYPKDKIPKLYVDSEKIAWVLTNLLSNAIRYSPENGRVIIGAQQLDEHHIQLFVQDFGRGIDPRYHESIFERYFRVPGTKIQGSGLGLSISRDFVEAHSGTLTVASELGKGSRFVVTLPV